MNLKCIIKNMENNSSSRRPVALTLTVLGALGRLLPHPPNFTPVGSVSLFAGARLPLWQAYLVPLIVMALTDPIVSLYYHVAPFTLSQVFIYSSLLISVWIGRRLCNSNSVARIGGAALLCSLQFFFITNFPVWLLGSLYPKTAAGLAACYTAGLPFLGWTVAGDLFYAGVLFGLHAWLSRTVATSERVPSAA